MNQSLGRGFCWALIAVTAMAGEPSSTGPSIQPELNIRLRFESRGQTYTFDRAVSSPTDGSWLLTRVRLGLKAKLDPQTNFYAQAQDSRELGSDRPSVPFITGSEGDDPLDLRQLYFERTVGDASIRVGRQLLGI